MQVKGMSVGSSGSSSDRTGKNYSWGDCGAARTTTKEYEENFDKVFGNSDEKSKEEVERSPEEQARLERNAIKRMAYPY